MRINVVDKLRKYDAAIMELGLEYTDKMAIPPGQLAFPLSGYCIAECTQVVSPLNVFFLSARFHKIQTSGSTKIRHDCFRVAVTHAFARSPSDDPPF